METKLHNPFSGFLSAIAPEKEELAASKTHSVFQKIFCKHPKNGWSYKEVRGNRNVCSKRTCTGMENVRTGSLHRIS